MRNIYFNKLKSYVIKNAHINCDKDTYDVLIDSIVKPLNEEMKSLMKKIYVYTLWGMKIKSLSSNIRKKKILTNQFIKKIIQIKVHLLISRDLAFFATVIGKVNMSGCWCNLSAKYWSDKYHIKGMIWTIDLFKQSLSDKDNNKNMTSYEDSFTKTSDNFIF